MNKYKLADWYDILLFMSLCICAGAVVLMCSQLQFSNRAPPSCVRAAPMAPNKQAVPMKGARHTALSAKTTIKKQAPRTVLRSIAAQAAGRTPGKQAGKAPRVTWIVVHTQVSGASGCFCEVWLAMGSYPWAVLPACGQAGAEDFSARQQRRRVTRS